MDGENEGGNGEKEDKLNCCRLVRFADAIDGGKQLLKDLSPKRNCGMIDKFAGLICSSL